MPSLFTVVRVLLWVGIAVMTPVALFVVFQADPTVTQAELIGWLTWGVPMGALLVDRLGRDKGRLLIKALVFGWGSTFGFCLLAALLFPHYPRRGPHEIWALGFYGASVVTGFAIASRLLRAEPVARSTVRNVGAASLLAISVASYLGGRLFHNPVAWQLPITAFPIQQAIRSDFVGEESAFAAAPLDGAQFERYVRAIHLEPQPEDPDRLRPYHTPSYLAPQPWNEAPENARVWVDPNDAKSTGRVRCWTHVVWDGKTAFASTGCSW